MGGLYRDMLVYVVRYLGSGESGKEDETKMETGLMEWFFHTDRGLKN